MAGWVASEARFLPLLPTLGIVSVVMYFYTSGLLERSRRRRKAVSEANSRTLDALWLRYERGEISWHEYEEKSRDLESE